MIKEVRILARRMTPDMKIMELSRINAKNRSKWKLPRDFAFLTPLPPPHPRHRSKSDVADS